MTTTDENIFVIDQNEKGMSLADVPSGAVVVFVDCGPSRIANDGAVAKSWSNSVTSGIEFIQKYGVLRPELDPPKPPTPKQNCDLPSIPLKARRKMLAKRKGRK